VAPKKRKKKTRKQPRKHVRLPGWVGYALLIIALAVHIGLVMHFDFTQDDAFITFRYAANYLDGHGLVYNIGERVEGYTNFFWTILMILGGLLSLDYVVFSKMTGALFGIGTIALLFRFAHDIFKDLPRAHQNILAGSCCLIVGTVYSFAYWTVAGLETAAFALMVLASIHLYNRRSYLVAATAILATLLRPEGGLVFAFLFLYEIISRRSMTRYALTFLIVYTVCLLPFAAFKIAYYNSLLPNPFYAKTSFNIRQIMNGLDYTGRFFWHYLAAGAFILPILVFFRKIPRGLRVILVFLLVYTAYITFIGGDVLKVHRFFVPLFALFAIAVVYGVYTFFKGRIIFIFGIAAVIVWQMFIPKSHVDTFHRKEVGFAAKMDQFCRHLQAADQSDFSLAVSTIGLVGYRLMGHTVIDMLGLTDSTIARHPEPEIEGLETTWRETQFNSKYLLERQPDYILFSTGAKPSAPAERALYTYSAFLNNYRTIGFFFGSQLHVVFKRYFPIAGDIERDVSIEFVQNLNRGINQVKRDQPDSALASFETALRNGLDPHYPYVYYFISDAFRKKGRFQESYDILKRAASIDTVTYETYKDLYMYSYQLGDYNAAEYYRSIVARLVPWYMPRLDSLVRRIK